MDIHLPKAVIAFVVMFCLLAALYLAAILSIWRDRRKGRFAPFTENMFRLPGHSLRKDILLLSDDFSSYYFLFIIAAVVVVTAVVFFEDITRVASILAVIPVILFVVLKMFRQLSKLRDLKLGLEGEEYTGQELNLLMRKGAYVFHDIPYRYGNIDHIVIGNNRIFVVETKAIRKPANKGKFASRSSSVKFDGSNLIFPHFATSDPLEQSKRHAKFLDGVLKRKLGYTFPITPVVALPGWYVELDSTAGADVLVINPKRGFGLMKWLGDVEDKRKRNLIVEHIASVAQSILPSSKKIDPNASKYYDFWLNPKYAEKTLGED